MADNIMHIVMATNGIGVILNLKWFCMDTLPLSFGFPGGFNIDHPALWKAERSEVHFWSCLSPWLYSKQNSLAMVDFYLVAKLLRYLARSTSPTIKNASVSAANVREYNFESLQPITGWSTPSSIPVA